STRRAAAQWRSVLPTCGCRPRWPGVDEPVIDVLGDLGPAVQVGDSLTHLPPLQIVRGASLFGPVALKDADVIGSGFRPPEYAAARGIHFVIELGRAALHPKLDALAFPILLQVGLELSVKALRYLPRFGHPFAEISQHISAVE